jgi:hypothetical protein
MSEPAHGIRRRDVLLKPLPVPDYLDVTLPEGYVCLIHGDGTPLTARLAAALRAKAWPVVVLRNADDPAVNLPTGVDEVVLEAFDEALLAETLAALEPVGCFVHLSPPATEAPLFSERARRRVKQLFFTAKHLKTPLNAAAAENWGAFVAVTRLDGRLGLTGAGSPVDGGAAGVVKTLRFEWPQVNCRAVDLSPALATEDAVEYILAELHDPNRLLVEVGWTAEGRVTLDVGEGAYVSA